MKDPQRHCVALDAVAGGALYNIVVENEKVSKELLSKHCFRERTTFIPLNVIKDNAIDARVVQKIKELTNGKVRIAKELIQYDPKYEKAMNFAFGRTVNPHSVWQLLWYSSWQMMKKQHARLLTTTCISACV